MFGLVAAVGTLVAVIAEPELPDVPGPGVRGARLVAPPRGRALLRQGPVAGAASESPRRRRTPRAHEYVGLLRGAGARTETRRHARPSGAPSVAAYPLRWADGADGGRAGRLHASTLAGVTSNVLAVRLR